MCHRRVLVVLLLLMILVGAVDRVEAQTNPCCTSTAVVALTATSVLCFVPSPDHNATLPGGQPVVQEYAWEITLKGAPSPFYTVSLGKPTPGADGAIRIGPGALPSIPGMARFQEHVSQVTAFGPTGTGRSAEFSNGFFSAPVPTAPGKPWVVQ